MSSARSRIDVLLLALLAGLALACERPAESQTEGEGGTEQGPEPSVSTEPRLEHPGPGDPGGHHADAGHGTGAGIGTATGTGADARQHLDRMAHEHAGDSPVPTGATEPAPRRPVTTETVTYATVGGQPVSGYVARPADVTGPLPGLVVIHEWWGLNDNIRALTNRLAGEGYEALAVDLYSGQTADTPEQARALVDATLADMGAGEHNLQQAMSWLRERNGDQAIGAIGWCFGGGWALQAALIAPEQVDAAVIYYGRLVTEPEQLAPLQAAVLGHFGSADQSIPVDAVRAFESALQALGKTAQVYVYEGANHAFANASGQNYEAEAATQAWERTVAFLAEHLQR